MIICNRGSSLIRICCISSMRQRTLQIPRREENIVGVVIPVRSMTTSNCDTSDMVVPKEEVVRFIEECLCKVGTLKEDAHVVACHLMTSDYRGHFSHGMNRMQMYVNDIKNKIIDPVAKPNVIRDFKVRTNFFFFYIIRNDNGILCCLQSYRILLLSFSCFVFFFFFFSLLLSFFFYFRRQSPSRHSVYFQK